MKKLLFMLLVFGLVFTVSNQAHAILIVDTGEPTYTGGGASLYDQQGLAAQFSISQSYTVTSAYGWMRNYGSPQTLHFMIYGDNTTEPNSTIYYSGGFATGIDDGLGWEGITGLSVALNPGTYWASFEVQQGDTYSGYMPFDAPNPLNRYVWGDGQTWGDWADADLGIRINANEGGAANAVPEPATMALFGLGSLGVFLRKRFA